MDYSSSYKSWIIHNNISDHFPIALHFDVNPLDAFKPFKFDHSWLKNEDFCQMIRVFWANIICPGNLNVMELIVFKLKALKKEVTSWTKRKTTENRASLQQIETDISDMRLSNLPGSYLTEDKDNMSALTSL